MLTWFLPAMPWWPTSLRWVTTTATNESRMVSGLPLTIRLCNGDS